PGAGWAGRRTRRWRRRTSPGRAGSARPGRARLPRMWDSPAPPKSTRGRMCPVQTRSEVTAARRIVVKVGSSSLTTAVGGLDPARLDALVEAVAGRIGAGVEIVLVSSGAIAAGLTPLGLPRRPRDLATQQAAASVGQGLLVHRYTQSFGRYGLTIGQVLLT